VGPVEALQFAIIFIVREFCGGVAGPPLIFFGQRLVCQGTSWGEFSDVACAT
jgi:hypothetical protein